MYYWSVSAKFSNVEEKLFKEVKSKKTKHSIT